MNLHFFRKESHNGTMKRMKKMARRCGGDRCRRKKPYYKNTVGDKCLRLKECVTNNCIGLISASDCTVRIENARAL